MKEVKEYYRCECGCGEDIVDTVSSSDFEVLFTNRETYPDSIKEDMNIQFTSHTSMDDYKVYEVQGQLCLALMIV